MKKVELIEAVAKNADLSKKDAEIAVNTVFDTIVDAVAKAKKDADAKVQIVGFGTFERRKRNARVGCDPRTGKKINIPASKVPAFKPGKAFKEAVNK